MECDFNLEEHQNFAVVMASLYSKRYSPWEKNHNLTSYVAFVDLVKAYDMANHNLLLDLLERYGVVHAYVDQNS